MKKADDIVTYLKSARNDVFKCLEEDIDFRGCSQSYVEEKTNALIFALKELTRHCKARDKAHKV